MERRQAPTDTEAVYLSLGFHDHQPTGNFSWVYAEHYEQAYLPFLDVMERHPRVPFSLHLTGPLLLWLAKEKPEYLARLRSLVAAGRLDLKGGGFYEPILALIPDDDKREQLRRMTGYLVEQFGFTPTGAWIAERVWEPQLARVLAEAGLEYAVLDDSHFLAAGVDPADTAGYYVTEEQGWRFDLFPISKELRYLIPFHEPEETIAHLADLRETWLARLADGSLPPTAPPPLAVYDDDGEKFGGWAGTNRHVYENGWLERFLCSLEEAVDGGGLRLTTLSDYRRAFPPLGRIYVPTCSYAEMLEWSGGFFRNFLVRYDEANLLHKRMLYTSGRVRRRLDKLGVAPRHGADTFRDTNRPHAGRGAEALPDALLAWDHVLRAQCNDPYWHGVFGGLYLPHLRQAAYADLLAAERLLGPAAGPALEVLDLDLDAAEEVILRSSDLVAVIRPARGGALAAFDHLPTASALLDVLRRRREPEHGVLEEPRGADARVGDTLDDLRRRRRPAAGGRRRRSTRRRGRPPEHPRGRPHERAGARAPVVRRHTRPRRVPRSLLPCEYDHRGDPRGTRGRTRRLPRRPVRACVSCRHPPRRCGSSFPRPALPNRHGGRPRGTHREDIPARCCRRTLARRHVPRGDRGRLRRDGRHSRRRCRRGEILFAPEVDLTLLAGWSTERYVMVDGAVVEHPHLAGIASHPGARSVELVDQTRDLSRPAWLGSRRRGRGRPRRERRRTGLPAPLRHRHRVAERRRLRAHLPGHRPAARLDHPPAGRRHPADQAQPGGPDGMSAPPLSVAFVWHMHQPYYKRSRYGSFDMPWVRLHALKDYLDMVEITSSYPSLHQTFNLVPSLVEQIDDYARGDFVDPYWNLTMKPAADLDVGERGFVVDLMCERSAHPRAQRYPRYLELSRKREAYLGQGIDVCAAAFDVDELRDLQIWFTLAWFDPVHLRDGPLADLVSRGRDFTEADKQVLAAAQADILARVLPAYRQAEAEGRVELTTSPYFHPILPLLINTDISRISRSDAPLPPRRFAHPEDAREQIRLAMEHHAATFGRRPRGMWCSELGVGEDVVPMLTEAGLVWTIADEGILGRSLGQDIVRTDGGRVQDPDRLYHPYRLEREGR